MRPEALYKAIHSEPFRAFTIHVTDGTEYRVHHPDWVGLPPGARTAAIFGENDAITLIDVGLVTRLSIEPLQPAGKIAGSDEPR